MDRQLERATRGELLAVIARQQKEIEALRVRAAELEARRWDEAQAEVNRAWLPYYRLLTEDVAPYTSGEALVDKLGLAWRGLPGGPNRPPTRQLTPELKEKAWQFFRAIGLPRA
jgi:hypothetical protein